MRCSICKQEYEKKQGIIRFWRTYVIRLCGKKACFDESHLKIMEHLNREGKINSII